MNIKTDTTYTLWSRLVAPDGLTHCMITTFKATDADEDGWFKISYVVEPIDPEIYYEYSNIFFVKLLNRDSLKMFLRMFCRQVLKEQLKQ